MSAERIDVLAVMDAEAAAVNRIRRSLGEWLGKMEDTNWDVNGSGGPDESDLSDLNNAVIRLREARAAVAELIERERQQRETLEALCGAYIANRGSIGQIDFVRCVAPGGRLADTELGRLWLKAHALARVQGGA